MTIISDTKMKQGGTTHNQSGKSKHRKGSYKCKLCNREYAMDWARERHQSQCETFRKNKLKN
jgi:hypothetical protein